MSKSSLDIEQLVLKESILSATGIDASRLEVGLKGDPSLRETSFARKRYDSLVDSHFEQLIPCFIELLTQRSTYRLYIGFNNGEIRTHSIFDPLRVEIHSAEKLVDEAYFERQFPKIPYQKKIAAIAIIYDALENSGIYQLLPGYWHRILQQRNANWEAMSFDEIPDIIYSLKKLRDIEDYYLRNVTICTIQDFVRTQFNCDGTQLVNSKNYQDFIKKTF